MRIIEAQCPRVILEYSEGLDLRRHQMCTGWCCQRGQDERQVVPPLPRVRYPITDQGSNPLTRATGAGVARPGQDRTEAHPESGAPEAAAEQVPGNATLAQKGTGQAQEKERNGRAEPRDGIAAIEERLDGKAGEEKRLYDPAQIPAPVRRRKENRDVEPTADEEEKADQPPIHAKHQTPSGVQVHGA